LLLATLALVVSGVTRGFAPDRRWLSKITVVLVGASSLAGLCLFVYKVLIVARELPASTGAPIVGVEAPAFTLVDLDNHPVSLASLLTTPLHAGAAPPRGVLLIFYRGYW
jgi:hypothetical protein